jgi:hypothetical protein
MTRLIGTLLAFIALIILATPAFADDPKSAFMAYLRSTYNAKSMKAIAQYLPEDLAKAINSQNNPEAEKQALQSYRGRYLGNVKFEYDVAADPTTQQLAGSGTNMFGVPTAFQVTMIKQKDGWKLSEWSYQPDADWIKTHKRQAGLIR